MAEQPRSYNLADRIDELGETPEQAYAAIAAAGGDLPPFPPSPIGEAATGGPAPDPEPGGKPAAKRKRQLPPIDLSRGDGTIADTIEPLPELTPSTTADENDIAPDATLGELFGAEKTLSRPFRTDFGEAKLRDGYAPILDALGLGQSQNPANFTGSFGPNSAPLPAPRYSSLLRGQGKSWLSSWTYRETQERLIAEAIRRRRQSDPKFLEGVPDTVEGLHAYFLEQEKARRGTARAVSERGSGFAAGAARLAGGIAGTFDDPANLAASLVPGGQLRSIAVAGGREALINGGLEVLLLPSTKRNLEELGEELTTEDAAKGVAFAAAGGAALGSAMHTANRLSRPAGEAAGKAYDRAVGKVFEAMPQSVQRRWADRMKAGSVDLTDLFGDVDNRELAEFGEATIGKDRMTPDERSAATVLRREQEDGEASPFDPGLDGDAIHTESLAEAIQAVLDAPRPSAPRGPLLSTAAPAAVRSPTPTAAPVRQASPDFERQWQAIIGNERGTDRQGRFLTSPKGAIGPAQVMPGTAPEAARLAGVPFDNHRYRTDHAYNVLLGRAYYAEQLRIFGDPSMAAAAYNAGPGSARRGTGVRGAVARATRAGRPGDWEAFLPAETRQYVADFRRRTGTGDSGADPAQAAAGSAVDGDEAAIAALRAEADAADAEALALSRDAAEIEPVPLLRRDLFASDEQWAAAQRSLYRSLNDAEDAAGAPPARETDGEAPDVAQGATNRAAGASEGAVAEVLPAARAPTSIAGIWKAWQRDGREPQAMFAMRSRGGVQPPGYIQGVSINRADIERMIADTPGEWEVVRFDPPAPRPSGPLTRAELEAMRPEYLVPGAQRDSLWLAASNIVDALEAGREPSPLWGVRDRRTGDIVNWTVNKRASARAIEDQWEPEHFALEKLTPETIAAELRARSADQAAIAAGAEVRLDDPALKAFDAPQGEGQRAQAESLEHDLRMDAAAAAEAARPARPLERGLPEDAPLVAAHATPLEGDGKSRVVTSHPDHRPAKAGDADAAFRLVRDVATPELLASARELGPDVVYVAPSARDGGRNAIPTVLAHRLAAESGAAVDREIVEAVRGRHSVKSAWGRILFRAEFEGPVDPGRRYVIVDDIYTSGGTAAALADHIQRGGGKVEAVMVLASQSKHGPHARDARALAKLQEEDYAQVLAEYDIRAETLTGDQARALAAVSTADRLRAKLAQAVETGGARKGRRAAGGGESGEGRLSEEQDLYEAPPEQLYRLTEDGPERPLGEYLAELDREREVIETLRNCLK